MTPAYRLSPRAERDLEEIWAYSAMQWSSTQAERYVADILDVIEVLSMEPNRGRPIESRPGYLKRQTGRHFVVFRRTDLGVDVIRVLHQSMDVGRHL